jgi:threonine dehydratase
MLQQGLDDFVLLTEEDLADGVRLALRTTHNLAEGAGAASLAAAARERRRFAGLKVVVVMSAGYLDTRRLAGILSSESRSLL